MNNFILIALTQIVIKDSNINICQADVNSDYLIDLLDIIFLVNKIIE